MKYPKRIILGIGGTHPDFLCACFRLMERGTKTKISSVGRVELKSKFKNETLDARLGGIKDLKLSYDYHETEVSHIWYNEYENFPSKFLIINVKHEILDPIFEMFEQKIKNTNLLFKYWPTKLINYLKSKNISSKEIFKAFSIDNLKKFYNCKNLQVIEINNIYNKSHVIELLKSNNVYNKQYEDKFNHFYDDWYNKNKQYINKINMYYNENK